MSLPVRMPVILLSISPTIVFIGLLLAFSVLGCGDPGDPAICRVGGQIFLSGLALAASGVVLFTASGIIVLKRKFIK